MQVLVMTAVHPNEVDLQIVIITREAWSEARVSPVVTLEGAVCCRAGNPYLVYGDAVAEFTGCNALDTTINVFDCRSGGLSDWCRGYA